MDSNAAFLTRLPWRVGRRVGRTVYAQFGADPADTDVLIGLMDSPALADEVVAAHNVTLAMSPRDGRA